MSMIKLKLAVYDRCVWVDLRLIVAIEETEAGNVNVYLRGGHKVIVRSDVKFILDAIADYRLMAEP